MVAHAPNSQVNGKSPTQSAFQFYFGGLDAFGHAYDPLLKGVARTQLEMLGFLNRRAQAYMQIPARVAQCRTPQDLINAQVQFWQAAYQDYTESAGRVTNAMAACSLPNLAAMVSEDVRNARDYIAFPDTPEPAAPSRSRERKAA
ncbi:phasin family protein [Hyphomicrobium sp. NDB2Meth4]|uniref:phasin family protein n=1 Tax=Hyphomicrobium sp. NDB2Meth4 TaxID=1892846 RepID=UPI00093003FA|nr:phasin family protein [Hyphomicrobium sp. NDB2Meth4]